MTWKNDSNAYSEKPTYGNLDEQIKIASQKYTAQNAEVATEKTKAFFDNLAPGTYKVRYPMFIWAIVKDSPELTVTAYDKLTDTVTVVKE